MIRGKKQIIYSKSKILSALITRLWLCDDGVKHGFHVCFRRPDGAHAEAPLNSGTVRGVASWRFRRRRQSISTTNVLFRISISQHFILCIVLIMHHHCLLLVVGKETLL